MNNGVPTSKKRDTFFLSLAKVRDSYSEYESESIYPGGRTCSTSLGILFFEIPQKVATKKKHITFWTFW